jgi:hypothetical protein
MATPIGTIGLSDVNAELGFSPTALITMNDAAVRTLAGVGGAGTVISMNDLRGKSARIVIPLTISTDTLNYDVYANRGPTYVAGESDITVTIDAPVVVGSATIPAYAFSIPSEFDPADNITVINNGIITGAGGAGGNGGRSLPSPAAQTNGAAGGSGGSAVFAARPVVITNNGTLAGGGGGGGGAGGFYNIRTFPEDPGGATSQTWRRSGSGGGGGQGSDGGAFGLAGPSPGTPNRGLPGSAGTALAAGAGGPGVSTVVSNPPARPNRTSTAGGNGGGFGSSGVAGETNPEPFPTIPGLGGAGGGPGAYLVGAPFVTFPVEGTRLGPSS